MLTSNIILAISGRDTLRPLDISFRPFTKSVHDTEYHERCTIINEFLIVVDDLCVVDFHVLLILATTDEALVGTSKHWLC